MRESLGTVEKKVLGALLILADTNKDGELVTAVSTNQIAEKMGYKKSGGVITYALRILEHKNIIAPLEKKGTYKILI